MLFGTISFILPALLFRCVPMTDEAVAEAESPAWLENFPRSGLNELDPFTDKQHLRELDLSFSDFDDDDDAKLLANFPNLESLNLEGSRFLTKA